MHPKVLLFLTFLLGLWRIGTSAQGLQYGKVRISQQTDEGHYCEAVSFPYSYSSGRDPVRVFVSVNHGEMSSGVHGSPLAWAESVDSNGFRACMVEHGAGSGGNATVDWVAFQGTQQGVAQGRKRFNRFTSGVQCSDIIIPRAFSSVPKVLLTSRHGVRDRKQDAVLVWSENVARGGFKICLREARHFDGPHRDVEVEWMAYVSPPSSWNAKDSGTVRFADRSSPSEIENFAYCKVINFTKPFYQPPSILFSPNHVYDRSDPNSISPDCNGINVWAEEITRVSFRVCMKDMKGLDGNQDPIMADYVVFGDFDPCLNVTCEYFAVCKAFSRDDARCICNENCPSYEDLMCASNGVTFDNLCLLKKEVCRTRGNYTHYHPGSCSAFPLQKGRNSLRRTPTWSDAVCVLVNLAPYTFYPDKKVHVQTSVTYVNASDKSHVHEATVTWVESVTDQNFTACVTTTGRNDKPSPDMASVDWIAYQGSPEGAVNGEEKFASWWTDTTCRTVNLPRGKFQNPPVILVTAEHLRVGLKHDAAHIWTQNIRVDRFDICMRELQNFDGIHEKIVVNWLAFERLNRPLFSEYGSVSYRSLSQPPPSADNFAYCQSVQFALNHSKVPVVVVTAEDSSTLLYHGQAGWYGVSAWIEYITTSGFRACLKDVNVRSNTNINLTYAVLAEICNEGWTYYKGYCYRTTSSCESWNNAQSVCSTYGANLPSIKNQEENVYVQQRHGGEKAWTGFNDVTTEGRFIWSDGTSVNFTNWAKGQPNDLNGQDCVHTLGSTKNYKWNDVQCSECHNYTCKKDYDECAESSHQCPPYSTCINTIGSYDCHCRSGYSMVRGKCRDIDECSISHGCGSNSVCINTVGSYVCECGPGYYKNRQNGCTAVSITASYSGGGGITWHPSRTKGLLWSPSFPGRYPHNSNCYWSLSSQVNISLKFSHFNTERTNDPLYVYDGGSTSAPLIGQYSGSSRPPMATSSSNQLYLRFTSDGSNSPCGFIGSFKVTQSGSLRLAGGSYNYGRVEMYYNGEWGTICDSSWDMNDANVVCRQLGYPGASSAPRGAYYGQGSGRIWLDNVRCSGSENHLIRCHHNGLGTHTCSHSNDASVSCQSRSSSGIRLRNGEANYGRVEVYYGGRWGTVCDDGIDNNINGANVICRMLGFPSALAYFSSARFGQGSGPIWLDDVRCTGSEASITQCTKGGWGNHNCNHAEDFSVYCNT